MEAPSTTYDFPKDNPGPFDIEFKGNYFVMANGYSNLSRKRNDFSLASLNKNIPMGYKTVIICYRLAIVECGVIIKSWNRYKGQLKDDGYSGKYHLSSIAPENRYMPDWDRTISSLSIYKPEATNGSLHASAWDEYADCEQYAINLSLASDNKFILSIILETHSWH